MHFSISLGCLPEALALSDATLAWAVQEPTRVTRFDLNLYPWALGRRGGWILAEIGRCREGFEDLARALDVARRYGRIEETGWLLSSFGMIADRADRPDTAVAHARQGLEIAERIGRALSVVFARAALGAALLASGDSSEAVPLLEAAIALARERRVGLDYEARFLAWLADAYLAAGDPARARATATEATEIGRQRGTRHFECYAQLALARALRATDGASARPAIEAALARAQALIDETGGRSLQPFLHIERAELLALSGDAAARQRELREAQQLFTAMGATARAEQVAKELGS